jgi:hypothetical protein
MSIWLLSSLSIQPRTSLSKIEGDFIHFSIHSLLSTNCDAGLTPIRLTFETGGPTSYKLGLGPERTGGRIRTGLCRPHEVFNSHGRTDNPHKFGSIDADRRDETLAGKRSPRSINLYELFSKPRNSKSRRNTLRFLRDSKFNRILVKKAYADRTVQQSINLF